MKILVAKIVQIPRTDVPRYIKEHKDTFGKINEVLGNCLFIVDKSGLTLDNIEDYFRLANARLSEIDIVAVDYFQMMRGRNTLAEEEDTAKRLKGFAKDHNVVFVVLSQLNKTGQGKDGNGKWHEPEQKDLRGSGAIGDTGDYIYLLWRRILDPTLSPIDREKYKYISCVKATKARERRNGVGNEIYELEYNPLTSRLTEKVFGEFEN